MIIPTFSLEALRFSINSSFFSIIFKAPNVYLKFTLRFFQALRNALKLLPNFSLRESLDVFMRGEEIITEEEIKIFRKLSYELKNDPRG